MSGGEVPFLLGKLQEAVERARAERLENACLPDPTKCTCSGHRWPNVRHIAPCCDEPHIDQLPTPPADPGGQG